MFWVEKQTDVRFFSPLVRKVFNRSDKSTQCWYRIQITAFTWNDTTENLLKRISCSLAAWFADFVNSRVGVITYCTKCKLSGKVNYLGYIWNSNGYICIVIVRQLFHIDVIHFNAFVGICLVSKPAVSLWIDMIVMMYNSPITGIDHDRIQVLPFCMKAYIWMGELFNISLVNCC